MVIPNVLKEEMVFLCLRVHIAVVMEMEMEAGQQPQPDWVRELSGRGFRENLISISPRDSPQLRRPLSGLAWFDPPSNTLLVSPY
jgi:hypothetical protein